MPEITMNKTRSYTSSIALQWPEQTGDDFLDQGFLQLIDLRTRTLGEPFPFDYFLHDPAEILLPRITPVLGKQDIALTSVQMKAELSTWRGFLHALRMELSQLRAELWRRRYIACHLNELAKEETRLFVCVSAPVDRLGYKQWNEVVQSLLGLVFAMHHLSGYLSVGDLCVSMSTEAEKQTEATCLQKVRFLGFVRRLFGFDPGCTGPKACSMIRDRYGFEHPVEVLDDFSTRLYTVHKSRRAWQE